MDLGFLPVLDAQPASQVVGFWSFSVESLAGVGSGKPQGWFTGDYYTANLKTNSLEKWEETLVNAGHVSRDPL